MRSGPVDPSIGPMCFLTKWHLLRCGLWVTADHRAVGSASDDRRKKSCDVLLSDNAKPNYRTWFRTTATVQRRGLFGAVVFTPTPKEQYSPGNCKCSELHSDFVRGEIQTERLGRRCNWKTSARPRSCLKHSSSNSAFNPILANLLGLLVVNFCWFGIWALVVRLCYQRNRWSLHTRRVWQKPDECHSWFNVVI